jgi:acetyl esterase/lipase
MSLIAAGNIMLSRLAGHLARIVTLPLALSGCTGPELLSLAVSRSGIAVHEDLAYGSDPRQKLDLYVPDKRDDKARLLVFFYGGGWDDGGKAGYLFAVRPFLDAGYVVAIADYRIYPQAHFPDFVEDGAAALRWLVDNAGPYGADTEQLYLAGHSAGAYNAMMLALDERYLRAVGLSTRRIAALVGLAGPYDFSTRTADLAAIFAGASDAATQPVNLVTPNRPPIFLAHGDADTTVYPRNSQRLAERLGQTGNEVELKTYPGIGHVGLVTAMTSLLKSRAPVAQDALDFLARH